MSYHQIFLKRTKALALASVLAFALTLVSTDTKASIRIPIGLTWASVYLAALSCGVRDIFRAAEVAEIEELRSQLENQFS